MKRYMIAAGALLALLAALMFIYQDHHRLILPPSPPSGSPTPSPTPTPTPIPAHEVYVANMGHHSILGFAIDANGTVAAAPTRVIQGPPDTGLHNPFDVATDSAERIYVANLGDPPGNGSTVTVYSATANGAAVPIRTLGTSSSPNLPALHKATSIVVRPRPENILVTDQPGPLPADVSRVLEYSPTIGQDDPIGTIQGASTQLEGPMGIALDATQRIYVVDPVRNRVLVYVWRGSQLLANLTPTVIEGADTLLNSPMDAAFDSAGNLYVANRGSGVQGVHDASITVYAPGASGPAVPIRRIFGPAANLVNVVGIAVDAAGRIFVGQGNSLKVFAAGANGNVAPQQVISGAMSNAGGISVR